jgi:phosphoribosylaminoimidazole-succinocarboxamide synthase
LIRKGKVREVYAVGEDRILLVASDRISAFDVILEQPIPRKGEVLTQISAYWFRALQHNTPSHFVTADAKDIIRAVPDLADHEAVIRGRSMLVRRTEPVMFECVVRGYLAGSAWKEYRTLGTLAGEPLPKGLSESSRLDPPLFSPATKAETGHDENVTLDQMRAALGGDLADRLRDLSLTIYRAGRDKAAMRGIIIADTKFEFGHAEDGELLLIDEVLTPDSSRFWPADEYEPGRAQKSFDKQPVRDHLDAERAAGRWDGESPPRISEAIVRQTSERYLDAYRRITGSRLPDPL